MSNIIVGINFIFINNSPITDFVENPKIADFWILDQQIIIDDLASNNWTSFKGESWLSGNGTLDNPFIIENVTINGYKSQPCIEIRNSKKFFIIRNCTLYNSSSGSSFYRDAGIMLSNTTNGKIIDNNILNNYGNGITLISGSNNNTFISNNISNNDYYGIFLYQNCVNNTISGNKVNANGDYGISLSLYCDDNTISGNTLSDNGEYEIYLGTDCTGLNIYNNNISGGGLHVYGSLSDLRTHNINTSNEVNGKPLYYYVDKIGLNAGDFSNAGQIILINCSYSTVSGLNISNTCNAIYLYLSSNNTIIGNNISNNDNGIFLDRNCYDNDILGNTASDNDYYGIYLSYECNDNSISGNTANENGYYGIFLFEYCVDNTISGNTASDNGDYGIHLIFECNDNTISGNTANENGYQGIYIVNNCYYNNISSNTVNNNSFRGILLEINCNSNSISGNTAINNHHWGIVLGTSCNSNNISSNTLNENYDYGIYIKDYSDGNIISGNTVSYNYDYGIYIYSNCDDNIIFNNTFAKNTINARDNGVNNSWDNGSIGNYWEDYTGVDEVEPYGIGDIPYNISGTAGAQDLYPLMEASLNADFVSNVTSIFESEWIQFNYTGYGGNGELEYSWNFGDGETSIEKDPIHQYDTAGTYTVNLTVVDEDDDEDTETKYDYILVEIDSQPSVNFTVNTTSIFESEWIQFNYTGYGGNGELEYSWNFGDGETSIEQDPIHQYDTAGTYTVNLTVVDEDDDEDTETKYDYILVEIDSQPSVNFTANTTNILESEWIQFNYTGYGGDGELEYSWNFGDGEMSTEKDPIHQYDTAGTYTVNLTVVDEDDDEDTETKYDYILVEIDSQPSVNFTANTTSILESEWIQFNYTGYNGNGELEYSWNFGDGETSIEQDPIHQYDTAGTYTVTLTVIDEDDDSDTEIKIDYLIVNEPPSDRGGSIPGYDLFLIFGSIGIISIILLYISKNINRKLKI